MLYSLLAQRQRTSFSEGKAICGLYQKRCLRGILRTTTSARPKKKGVPLKARPLKIQPPLIPASPERGLRAGRGRCSRCRCGRCKVALERLGDLLFRHGADNLLDHLAILENEKCGDTANVVAAGGIHGLVHVELGDFELARVI